MDSPVIIKKYTSEWLDQFIEEKRMLNSLLGGKIIAIEHIGSTAIEGLGGKGIIDIALGVTDLEIANEFIEPIKPLGYEFVLHKDFPERRFFRKGQWRAGSHHLHVYLFEGEHWKNLLLFRDYLSHNPDALNEYYQLKIQLAQKFRYDRVSYTNSKSYFIQDIIQRAKLERQKR